MLSHLDGNTTESDIALATGLDATVIRQSLDKLRGLGAVSEISAPPRSSPRPPPGRPSGTFHIGPVIETRSDSSGNHPAAALYDPSELDESVDLDLPRKRKILDTFYRLSVLSHYELLGVDAGADKKAIKAAYFELVNDFHPDRYFGKSLGSFKPKLERLFTRVTEAHDVLTRVSAREDYDRYLTTVRHTEALDRTLADRGGHAREVERLTREIQEQVQLEEKARHSYPPPAASAPPIAEAELRSSPLPAAEHATPSLRPSDSDARRRALARKLGVSMPPARISSQPAALRTPASREAATADLKRRYEERIVELKHAKCSVTFLPRRKPSGVVIWFRPPMPFRIAHLARAGRHRARGSPARDRRACTGRARRQLPGASAIRGRKKAVGSTQPRPTGGPAARSPRHGCWNDSLIASTSGKGDLKEAGRLR